MAKREEIGKHFPAFVVEIKQVTSQNEFILCAKSST